MRKSMKKVGLLSFMLSLLLIFTACNSANTASTGGASKNNDSGVIKIGAILAETGPASTLGKTEVNYVKLLQKQLDSAGPINGKKIQIIMQDYETDDTKAVVAADNLISNGVVAVVGATQASTTMAIAPKITAAGLPLMTVAPVNPDTKGIQQMPVSNITESNLIIKFLKQRNIKKVAWINARDGFGVDGLPSFEKVAKENNIDIVAHEEFDATATDMTVQLTNIRKKSPEAVIVWSRTPGAGIVARNFKSLGFNIPLIESNAAANQGFVDQVKENSKDIYVAGSKLNVVDQLPDGAQKKQLKAFSDEYRAMFTSDPDNFTTLVADGFHFIIEAIKAGNTTPEKIKSYIDNSKEYQGLSGTFNFKAGNVGPNEDGLAMIGIENGKWKYIEK